MEGFDSIKAKYRTVAYHRAAVVRAYLEYDPSLSVAGSKDFAANILPLQENLIVPLGKRPSGTTLYRWARTYISSKHNPLSLAPRYNDGGGPGSRVLDHEEKRILLHYWADPKGWSAKKVVRRASEILGREIPYDTAARFLASQPEAFRIYFREGKTKFRDKCLPYIERDTEKYHSLEWVTSDHHMLDFFVQRNGRVFRPWITAFTDVRSRKVLSWIMCEAPNKYTILYALQVMTSRYGVPVHMFFDNGKDYRSQMLMGTTKEIKGDFKLLEDSRILEIGGVFEAIGSRVTFCQPHYGQAKPIERFFGTLAGDFSREQETYCGSNTATRSDEAKLYHQTIGKMKKRDVMLSFDMAAARLNRWMDKYNSSHEHHGQGMHGKSPDQVFQENKKAVPHLSETSRLVIFSEPDTRVVTKHGVEIEGVKYYDHRMSGLTKQKVIVRRPVYSDQFVFICDLDDRVMFPAAAGSMKDSGDRSDNLQRRNKARKEIMARMRKLEDEIRKTAGLPDIAQWEKQNLEKDMEYLEEYKKAVGAENLQNPSLLGSTTRPYRKPKPKLSLLG